MNFKSQRGYSLLEIGVGLILITIFMISGVTMLKGTYNTYRYIEQRDLAMHYLVQSVERELLDNANFILTHDPANTTIEENTPGRKVTVTKVPGHNFLITTTLENLPPKNGVSYANSRVKLLTSDIEFFIRNQDESSRRILTLKTLKIEGSGDNA